MTLVLMVYKHMNLNVGSNMTFSSFDLDPITLALKLDQDVVQMNQHTKIKFLALRVQKL